MTGSRLALLGLNHETNTFSPVSTTLADFATDGILRSTAILDRHATAHTSVAGLLTAAGPDVDVVPLLYASMTPSGLITDEAFEALVGEMIDLLIAGGPWDGVLLALHGAAVTAAYPDADGEVLRRVRAVVGPDTPVGAVLDMHANVSPEMAAAADVLVAFWTNPHVDARERGVDCADLVVRAARGAIAPVLALEQVPAVINIVRQSTRESPMRELVEHAVRSMDEPGILSVSVVEGYPYADVPEMGMSVLVVADGDRRLAARVAADLGRRVWHERDAFDGHIPAPGPAIRAALTGPPGPAVLFDVGDNVGGGGTGDSTVLLAAALAGGASRLVITIFDPAAVAVCVAAGPGAALRLEIGGRMAAGGPGPVVTDGTVRCLTDGRFEEPAPTHGGYRFFDAGPTAVFELPGDNLVVLTSRPILPTSLRQLRSVGIEPMEQRLLVAKGVVSPRAAYEPIASVMILVDTPGVTTANLGQFTYRHRRTPLFPFERDVPYPTGASQ